MVSNILRKIQQLAAVGAMSLCAASSASAGLFCNLECCQEARAWYSPACDPTWGYNQTCWRRFPAVAPCSGWGDYCPSCQTNGGVVNAGGYPGGGTQLAPNMQGMTQQPVLQGAPTVIQQPVRTYGAPMQQQPQVFAAPAYEAPVQGAPQYSAPVQQLQPMQSFDEPMQMNPTYGTPPNMAPQPQDNQPTEGAMPPLPNAAYQQQQQQLQNFGQTSQTNWQQPSRHRSSNLLSSIRPATTQAQPSTTQGVPIRGASFSRVPSNKTAAPRRTLLQRILPGGK